MTFCCTTHLGHRAENLQKITLTSLSITVSNVYASYFIERPITLNSSIFQESLTYSGRCFVSRVQYTVKNIRSHQMKHECLISHQTLELDASSSASEQFILI